jgi:group I intron endonuclease
MVKRINGIYGLQNLVTKRIYVGSSNNIKARWRQHKSYLKSNKHLNKYLQNSWNKHGEKSFKFFIIEECSGELLYEREQFWFDYYKEGGLVYNYREIVESNRGISYPMSEETKKKLSEANKGRKYPNRKITEETRKKLSEARRGKKWDEESKQKLRKRAFERMQDKSIVERISNTLKGRIISEETKKKMSESCMGRTSPMKGKKMTEESKQKMRDAWDRKRSNKEKDEIHL